MAVLDRLAVPVVLAPMAGGPGTPRLAAAVTEAGGLGFLPAGYLTPARLAATFADARARTDGPLGINVFWPPTEAGDAAAVASYADRLSPRAAAAGVALGDPATTDHDAECWAEALALRPEVVSVAFGCPSSLDVDDAHTAGTEVWVTVTDPTEAARATAVGADVLVAQGAEAGGHRGSFVDHDDPLVSLHDLLAALVGLGPAVVAAGGIMDGRDLGRARRAGAAGAQMGTAFLLTPEAGTSDVHRRAVARPGETVVTRAFSGRRARGIANAWTASEPDAPSAYPAVHHLTSPLRAHGRATGDPDLVNLWAGTGHARARSTSAAAVVRAVATDSAAG